MADGLTVAERLLLAAASLEETGRSPFSAEDLVVESHRKFPETFALRGYPAMPDSNRVFVEMMGQKPLKKNGWLSRIGPKRYRLSEGGRIAAQRVVQEAREGTDRAVSLDRKQGAVLARLLQSRAYANVRDKKDELIFQDACAFWDITPSTVASALADRIGSIEELITLAEAEIAHKAQVRLDSGRIMDSDVVHRLRQTHQLLLRRFERELTIIKGRKDDRSRRGKTEKQEPWPSSSRAAPQ